MNFLAHIYLSGNDEEIMIGNLLGDFLKRHSTEGFPERILLGVKLHKAIDKYTDTHPVVMETKKRLRPLFAHYSPVISDMYYDHFLSKKWSFYSDKDLSEFSQYCYKLFFRNRQYFPPRAGRLFVYMRLENLFVMYGSIEGIKKILNRMSFRTKFTSNLELATDELIRNYDLYEKEFDMFFKDLIDFVEIEKKKLSIT